MTYCSSWERCRNSYLTTCTNLILCRCYLSLLSHRAVPAGVGRVYTRYTSNARAMLIVCQDLLGIIIPLDVSSRCIGTYTPKGDRARRRFADVYARARITSTVSRGCARCSLIWTSPHRRGRNLCSIYQGFMRWLLRTVTGFSRKVYVGYISHNATIRRLKSALSSVLCAFYFKTWKMPP